VVPLGVSAHSAEPQLRPHTPSEAADVVGAVAVWQKRFLGAVGRRVVYASDELYLLAGCALPPVDEYDDFPQHENGIGMARSFWLQVERALAGEPASERARAGGFFRWVDGAPAMDYRAPRSSRSGAAIPVRDGAGVAIVTGEYGDRVLRPLLPKLEEVARRSVRLLTIRNEFFGGNIAVTGLLTGHDVAAALDHQPAVDRYLLPDVVLSNDRFLDGMTVGDLPRPVTVVPTDGASLVAALR
jgi:NifB/MoaA-like Fe-S oxidoreductase